MWGYQPGVQLLDNGRVASIVISGFGANGIVPDAIGQLTELRILNLGAHDELVGGHLFKDVTYNMTQEQRLKSAWTTSRSSCIVTYAKVCPTF